MMAFIGSVFNMIGSFINMVFGAVASVFHFVFSVLGGLLGLVLHLGMLLLVVGLVALVITRRKNYKQSKADEPRASTWTTAKPSRATTASNLQKCACPSSESVV